MSADRRPAALDPARPREGPLSSAYAGLVLRLRWIIVLGWLGIATAATLVLPSIADEGGDDLGGLIPRDNPAIRTELRALDMFGFPLTGRTIVVQHDPQGLTPVAQARSVLAAAAVNQRQRRDDAVVLGALPVPNTLGLFPSASERGTTVLTYLFMSPRTSFLGQQRAAQHYVDTYLSGRDDAVVGVTGSIPARAQQGRLVQAALPTMELLTVLAVVVLVGANFRSLVAPLIAVTAVAISFVVTLRIAGLVGHLLGVSVPGELEPLIVALLLGVVTDYAIFFLSALRRSLGNGEERFAAAHRATASFAPIVLAAGLTVAAGTAALLAAQSGFFRAFGPGMALAVLAGVIVSVTLVPALLAILGRRALWPSSARFSARDEMPGPAPTLLFSRVFRGRTITLLTRPRLAAAVFVVCTAGLVLAGLPLRHIQLGLSFTPSLPASNSVSRAAVAAGAGFAPGIVSPTTLLLEGNGLGARLPELRRLQGLVRDQPGVAGVFGPGEKVTPLVLGVVLARNGDAARMLIVLQDEPLGAAAIDRFAALRAAMPSLLARSGLRGVRADFAGDTALAAGIITETRADLGRIALAALVVNLLLLVIFLRALVAPLYLLASSVLALTGALGLTTWLFQDVLGHDGLTFYVPFAAAVLLVALGSDYNIFGVGHVWEEARHRPMREAIAVAVPESTRAITAAAITLAVSFALLAVVPLRPFRELAFAMAAGILLDAIVVRSFLVPAMLTLVGPASGWPSRRLHLKAAQVRHPSSADG